MNTDPETRETQNAESPQNFTLDPCPVEGFTAEGHHFHDPEDGGHPYADPIPLPSTAKPARFHPIAWIPTVEEFEPAMWGQHTGGAHITALALIRSRVTAWEPINPDAIKPGMRVRIAQGGGYVEFTVMSAEHIGGGYIDSGHVGVWAKEQPGRTWEVDPRTVPAEPEDPRVEVVRGWLKDDGDFSDADVRNLLARLDTLGGESGE